MIQCFVLANIQYSSLALEHRSRRSRSARLRSREAFTRLALDVMVILITNSVTGPEHIRVSQ